MQHAKNRGDADLIVRGIEAVLRGLSELGPRKQIACPALDSDVCIRAVVAAGSWIGTSE